MEHNDKNRALSDSFRGFTANPTRFSAIKEPKFHLQQGRN